MAVPVVTVSDPGIVLLGGIIGRVFAAVNLYYGDPRRRRCRALIRFRLHARGRFDASLPDSVDLIPSVRQGGE
jgi:hypothetical protein